MKDAKLYFDLDGVFADFFGEFAKTCGISSYKEYGQDFKVFLEYCEKHIHGTDFFLNLPKFDGTDKIIEEAHKQFGEFYILSSPLAGDEEKTAIQKTEWCKNNLHLNPNEIIISKTKTDYAQGNILIDDFSPNIKKWVEAGGIGIKYKANSSNYSVNDLISTLKYVFKEIDLSKDGFKPREIIIHKDIDLKTFIKNEQRKSLKSKTNFNVRKTTNDFEIS